VHISGLMQSQRKLRRWFASGLGCPALLTTGSKGSEAALTAGHRPGAHNVPARVQRPVPGSSAVHPEMGLGVHQRRAVRDAA